MLDAKQLAVSVDIKRGGNGEGKAAILAKGLRKLTLEDIPRQFGWDEVVSWGGIATAVGNIVNPKGPGTCDHCGVERAANIISSIPFFLVGWQTIKNRKTPYGKVFGKSLFGVGAASAFFHCSKGRCRSFARKVDYWTIALSSSFMTKAIFPSLPNSIWAFSLFLTPFKPFLVSSTNTLAMEIEFYRRAKKNGNLRAVQKLHSAACVAGMSCFCAEEVIPKTPLLHTMWHLASSMALATTNGILADVESTTKMRASQPNNISVRSMPSSSIHQNQKN